MGDVKEFDPEAILCKVCKKRKSVVLCDAITGHYKYAGHPPKINGEYSNEPMSGQITCDLAMCAKCTIKVTEYMDLCPEHAKVLKAITAKSEVKKLNAVLKYPGSKWKIAKWIINHFPKHHTYIEPYFGSGAVLFNKNPGPIETINDLDNKVTTLFEIIREEPEELAKLIAATPFSRYEYDCTFETLVPEDKFEITREFLVQCWQGHGFRTNGRKVGWKNDVQGREKAYALSNWYRLPGWIMEASERLRKVQIECRPAIEIIKRHNYKNVLIYADPPYLLRTRTGGKIYKHEMTDNDQIELLETLLQHSGPVILSGYNETLKKWHKESTKGYAEYIGADREEVIWMNFEPQVQQVSMSL